MAMTSQEQEKYLKEVLKSHSFDQTDKEVSFFLKRKEVVIKELAKRLGDRLADTPFVSGSIYKHTAVNLKYDVDIMVPFRHEAGLLSEARTMVRDAIQKLEEKSHTLDEIIDQKVSLGLAFKTQKGRECKIDVVIGRALPNENYKVTKNLNLYKHLDGSYIKTNVFQQRKAILALGGNPKEIIRLLKIMKFHKGNQKPKSFMIELLVIEAYRAMAKEPPAQLATQLEMVLHFIHENVMGMELIDPGNPDNNVSDQFTQKERLAYQQLVGKALSSLQKGHNWLAGYFPVKQ